MTPKFLRRVFKHVSCSSEGHVGCFISEGIFKQGRILQFQTLVKPRRVLLLPTCNCETCHSRRNQAVQSVGLYVLTQEVLGEITMIHALETHLLDL